MAFNVKKCMVMHFEARNQQYPTVVNGEKLRDTEEREIAKQVSNNLKPSAKCSRAAQTATAVLG
jgi:hypothetical protein